MKYLSKEDVIELNKLSEKNIKTGNLSNIFSKINLNSRFHEDEKEVLKNILIENINHAFEKGNTEK